MTIYVLFNTESFHLFIRQHVVPKQVEEALCGWEGDQDYMGPQKNVVLPLPQVYNDTEKRENSVPKYECFAPKHYYHFQS
mmetsp:Transcript_30943/g.63222  ORF Transcript_30943/g.63222 Transcript_30943/m.63222 type:complete len:80 (-) Transcript_30943:64-303(-)